MSKICDPQSIKAKDDKYICNPKTGRWVLRTGKIAQELMATYQSQKIPLKPKTASTQKVSQKTETSSPISIKSRSIDKTKLKTNNKENIIYYLNKMVDIHLAQDEKYKAKAYSQAILAIKNYPGEIFSGQDAKKIPGIGKSISEKIDQIIKIGKLESIPTDSVKNKAITELTSVWGIGPVKAESLYKLGIKSVEDLKMHDNLLTGQQKIGLKYYEDLKKKIPRQTIDNLNNLIKSIFANSVTLVIAGSYRRGLLESGDVDILFSPIKEGLSLHDVLNILQEADIVVEVLSAGPSKSLTVSHLPSSSQYFQLDLEYIPQDQWGSALLYFTGSKTFNIKMRELAKEKGYTLNQHGLVDLKTGNLLKFKQEEDIFKALGMDYIPPSQR